MRPYPPRWRRKVASRRFDEIAEHLLFYKNFYLIDEQAEIVAASDFQEGKKLPDTYRAHIEAAKQAIVSPQDTYEASFREGEEFVYLIFSRIFIKDAVSHDTYATDNFIIASVNIPALIEAFSILTRHGLHLRLILAGDCDPQNPGSLAPEQLREWASAYGISSVAG